MTTHAADTAAALTVEMVPILSDNYVYLLKDEETGTVGVVDPGAAAPIEEALGKLGWSLDWILLTHHHADHIDGVGRLVEAYGAKVVGAAADKARLPALDDVFEPGEDWTFGAQLVEVIDTPGHTVGHVALYFPRPKVLFSGDTLFALGCGRLFEGTAHQMWGALSALAKLPPETTVYCGHEYTLSNAKFALTVEAENPALKDRAAEIEALRAKGLPTIPTTIGKELATNPFLRASQPSVKAAVGMPGGDDAAVFAEVRRRKDAA
ncbi:MAG: hydroxyacylglutathione hydrolase [Pseudomonadota bacterium]